MNRQTRKRLFNKLNISQKEMDNIAEYFRMENEIKNKELITQFLALTIEALRLEFGFGQKRIDDYTRRVNNLLECINLDYVTFEDLLSEINITPMQVYKISDNIREEKTRELKNKVS